ncbi:SDR family NAD(P)-dependent oxidoreductase [Spirillospora sp. NPDC047279]|uniref:SDR family NAD(P)-dependent oxidoreductase n=1 Tax=Spirillospora sp. NPDC047279 TaxID=3155478 RepID=UPI0033F85B39
MTIALVTGANKGIGREIAAGLVARGVTVLLCARDAELGATAAQEVGARPMVLDVTDDGSVRAAAREVGERWGRLDVLVNNAGISGDLASQAPGRIDLANVRQVFETNVLGVIRVTEAMSPWLRRSDAARVVNVSSGVGSLGHQTDPGHYMSGLPASLAYPPSKTALNAVTVQYARAFARDGILVNAVAPGACATDFTKDLGLGITRTAADGAAVALRMATLGADGPTGTFVDDEGTVRW